MYSRYGQLRLLFAESAWPSVDTESGFDVGVPRFVVDSATLNPLLVAHRGTPLQVSLGIGPDRMPKLPRNTFDDLQNFFPDDLRWSRLLEYDCKKIGHSPALRIIRLRRFVSDIACHVRIDNSRLH